MRFPTGAIATPRHLLTAAEPHKAVGAAPPQFLWSPKGGLSMWGNYYFGDCVTAEEAFNKSCDGIFIPQRKVVTWARKNYVLNGAGLWNVMELMKTEGIDHDGTTYLDGGFKGVNWADAPTLQNAIWHGRVKLGVAAGQLQGVPGIGTANGWIATGFTQDSNLDHCTSACGYGRFDWMASQLSTSVPAGADPSTPVLAMFTWSTIGIIDVPSFLAITGEAWLRQPGTVVRQDT